ncbi:lasso RiPP family leader peptide-containing protein [Nonomuraea candida]|nr:lasso RiPP family leader peptide-containing protein [Nonomuraea candida]
MQTQPTHVPYEPPTLRSLGRFAEVTHGYPLGDFPDSLYWYYW